MHPNLLIVEILTVGFTLASFFAYVMQRLKFPPIIGYLLAGYIIGPYSPGFVADTFVAEQLAEIGVILMLFGVGLHFKIEDLLRVKNIVIPGAIAQTLVTTLFTTLIVTRLGWSLQEGIIISLSIAVASTVVLVRLLTDNNILNTQKGHIAVGWLVVEDIFTIFILILLPTIAALSGGETFSFISTAESILLMTAKFLFLILFMFTWGDKIINCVLTSIARLCSRELFTLTILSLIFVIAAVSSVVFGTSIALGAFIAGMMIGKTAVRHQAAANALPLKDIFTVIFFLSVGMLFNPSAIVTYPTLFLGLIVIILFVKPLIAYLITLSIGYSLNTALTVAVSLGQIGEFSFILAEEALNLNLIPDDAFDLLVACALVSISLNPLFFQSIKFFESVIGKFTFLKRIKKRSFKDVEIEEDKTSSKAVIIGFGPIGKEVAKFLKETGIIPIIIEQNIDTVSDMQDDNAIFFGDATEPDILKNANIEKASYLIITIPDIEKTIKIIHAARDANPGIQIIARIQYFVEKSLLKGLNVHYICTESESLDAFVELTHKVIH